MNQKLSDVCYYIAPNLPVTAVLKVVPISHMKDVKHAATGKRVCHLNPVPLVLECSDGYLPLDPAEWVESDLARHPDADRTVVLVIPGDTSGYSVSLIRRVRYFVEARPYLGDKGSVRLANCLVQDGAEDLLRALDDRASFTVDGVRRAVNALERTERVGRTSAYRALCRIREVRGRPRKCPRRRKKVINKAQTKLDWPDDNDPPEPTA